MDLKIIFFFRNNVKSLTFKSSNNIIFIKYFQKKICKFGILILTFDVNKRKIINIT